MADDISSNINNQNAYNAALAETSAQLAKNRQMADEFYTRAQKAEGAQREALLKLTELHTKIAKQQKETLEVAEDLKKLRQEETKILQEQAKRRAEGIKLTDKESAAERMKISRLREQVIEKEKILKQSKLETEAIQKTVKEMTQYQGLLKSAFSSVRTQVVASITSLVTLQNALSKVGKVMRDIQDIAIFSGNFDVVGGGWLKQADYIATYSVELSKATATLGYFGFKADETAQSFKALATLTKDPAALKVVTNNAGALARVLGVDLSESTDYLIDQTLKYNNTTKQSAQALKSVYDSVVVANTGLQTQLIRGRDVTKTLFDISRESRAAGQDQKYLATQIIQTSLALKQMGLSARAAQEGSSLFFKALTVNSPQFAKVLSGRSLLRQLTMGTDAEQKQLMADINKISPDLAKQVRNVLNSNLTAYEKEINIQALLQDTKVGMKTMETEIAKLVLDSQGKLKQGSLATIQAVYGMDVDAARTFGQALEQNFERQKKIKDLNAQMDMGGNLSEVRTYFQLDDKDIAFLKKLNKDEREDFLNRKNLQLANKKQKEDEKVAAEKAIADRRVLENDISNLRKRQSEAQTEFEKKQFQEMIDKKEEALNEGGIADQIKKAFTGAFNVQNQWESLKETLKSPLAAIIMAGAALATQIGLMIGQWGTLKQIERNTGGGGSMGEVSKGLLKGMGTEGKLAAELAKGSRIGAGTAVFKEGFNTASKLGKFGRTSGLLAAGVEVVSGAVDTYADYQAAQTEEEKQKALLKGGAKTTGAAVGAGAGAWGGAAAGAAIGTMIFPGVGTVIGGLLGGALGGYAGGAAGKYSGEKVYEATDSLLNLTPAQPVLPNNAQNMMQSLQPDGSVKQTAQLVEGAQGTDIEIITKLPIAQAIASNMALMDRFAARAPS